MMLRSWIVQVACVSGLLGALALPGCVNRTHVVSSGSGNEGTSTTGEEDDSEDDNGDASPEEGDDGWGEDEGEGEDDWSDEEEGEDDEGGWGDDEGDWGDDEGDWGDEGGDWGDEGGCDEDFCCEPEPWDTECHECVKGNCCDQASACSQHDECACVMFCIMEEEGTVDECSWLCDVKPFEIPVFVELAECAQANQCGQVC